MLVFTIFVILPLNFQLTFTYTHKTQSFLLLILFEHNNPLVNLSHSYLRRFLMQKTYRKKHFILFPIYRTFYRIVQFSETFRIYFVCHIFQLIVIHYLLMSRLTVTACFVHLSLLDRSGSIISGVQKPTSSFRRLLDLFILFKIS